VLGRPRFTPQQLEDRLAQHEASAVNCPRDRRPPLSPDSETIRCVSRQRVVHEPPAQQSVVVPQVVDPLRAVSRLDGVRVIEALRSADTLKAVNPLCPERELRQGPLSRRSPGNKPRQLPRAATGPMR
jgi:hypothetical protein